MSELMTIMKSTRQGSSWRGENLVDKVRKDQFELISNQHLTPKYLALGLGAFIDIMAYLHQADYSSVVNYILEGKKPLIDNLTLILIADEELVDYCSVLTSPHHGFYHQASWFFKKVKEKVETGRYWYNQINHAVEITDFSGWNSPEDDFDTEKMTKLEFAFRINKSRAIYKNRIIFEGWLNTPETEGESDDN